jgi:acyl-CoA thioester hydrolase
MGERLPPRTRGSYRIFRHLTTRWMDNDAYGHLNNATYYSLIDTAVTGHLFERGFLRGEGSAVIGLSVETGCRFFAPISFPDPVIAGLRIGHQGRTSVRYEVGLFRGDDESASAEGHFVHVYVDRTTSRPVPLPDDLLRALAPLEA